jgi:hypothetical protein
MKITYLHSKAQINYYIPMYGAEVKSLPMIFFAPAELIVYGDIVALKLKFEFLPFISEHQLYININRGFNGIETPVLRWNDYIIHLPQHEIILHGSMYYKDFNPNEDMSFEYAVRFKGPLPDFKEEKFYVPDITSPLIH